MQQGLKQPQSASGVRQKFSLDAALSLKAPIIRQPLETIFRTSTSVLAIFALTRCVHFGSLFFPAAFFFLDYSIGRRSEQHQPRKWDYSDLGNGKLTDQKRKSPAQREQSRNREKKSC